MITLFSGTPGSGKSLHAAALINGCLKYKKFAIVSNVPISKSSDAYIYLSNLDMTPRVLAAFSAQYFETHKFREGAIKLIIDEAQLLFNSREWQRGDRAEWLSFFTQHRKLGFDVILISQFDRMLDRQIRALIEYEYVHRKVSNFGFKGKLMAAFAGGRLFVAVKVWYPLKEKVGSEYFVYRKSLGSLYDTNAFFDNSLDGKVSFSNDGNLRYRLL